MSPGLVVGLELAGVFVGEVALQQPRLPHEEGLDALGTVAPAGKEVHVGGFGQQLEGETVGLAPEIVSQQPVAALLPVAVTLVEKALHGVAFPLQPLEQQAVEGAVEIELRDGREAVGTGYGHRCGRRHQRLVVVKDEVGDIFFQLDGREGVAVLERDGGVVVIHHMEHHVVVGSVVAVVVAVPVGGEHMHLDVSHPEGLPYPDARVEKVGAGIGVEQSRPLDQYLLPVGRVQRTLQQLVLPYILQQVFCHSRHSGIEECVIALIR